jgi:hypothetical protein
MSLFAPTRALDVTDLGTVANLPGGVITCEIHEKQQ